MDTSLEKLILKIEEPNLVPAKRLWSELQEHLPKAAGSTKSHHAWEFGYRDHLQEVMNLACILYERLNQERVMPFSLPSALLVLFLHDCEKPFKQASDSDLEKFLWVKQRPTKSDKKFHRQLVEYYGFALTENEWNGLDYAEGEKDDYVHGERVQGPLAAFCHVCDNISARIWFDEPSSHHI